MKNDKILNLYHFLLPLIVLFLHARTSSIQLFPITKGKSPSNFAEVAKPCGYLSNIDSIGEVFGIAIVMLLFSIWVLRNSNKLVRVAVPILWIYIAFVTGSRYIWDY